MLQGRTLIFVIVALLVGFGSGFVLRPVISPPTPPIEAGAPAPTAAPAASVRGTEYFAANLEEVRRVVAGCRAGSVQGDECANAQQAVTEAEGRDRFKKFTGH